MIERQLRPQAAACVDRDAKLRFPCSEYRLHLGITLQAFRHASHIAPDGFVARHIAGHIRALGLFLQLIPARDELIGPLGWIGPHLGFQHYSPDRPLWSPVRSLIDHSAIGIEHGLQIALNARA